MISVQNLCSPRTGRPVANQFKVDNGKGVKFFQSYKTIIARVEKSNVQLADKWDCSATTTKYLCEFLDDCGWSDMNKAKVRKYLEAKMFRKRAKLEMH